MAVLAGEGHHEAGEGRDEGFAFAGGHFGDAAFVQDHAADELDVEGSGAERGTVFGDDGADGIVHFDGDFDEAPVVLADALEFDVGVEVFELLGGEEFAVEGDLGVEGVPEADVAVHRFAHEGEGFGESVRIGDFGFAEVGGEGGGAFAASARRRVCGCWARGR